MSYYMLEGLAKVADIDYNNLKDSGFGPLADQPEWLIVLEFLLFSDLLSYWQHRMFHSPYFYNLHAVHHS